MLKLLSGAAVLALARACDTAEQLAADMLPGGSQSHASATTAGGLLRADTGSAPLTLLPQDEGDESPACLDGSPYGFYFSPSKSGSKKWTISIEGGGWCYDEVGCYARSKMKLGSSKPWSKSAGCGCMNTNATGLESDCNCIYMPYGDGASFSGYRVSVITTQ